MIHNMRLTRVLKVALLATVTICWTPFASGQEGYALSVETVVEHTEGSLAGMSTYRIYMNCANATDYVSSCSGDDANPLIFSSTSGEWYNNDYATGWNASGINPDLFSFFPDLVYDSFLTLGAEDNDEPSGEHPSGVWGDIDVSNQFDTNPGVNVVVNDSVGGAWYILFPGLEDSLSHPAFAGEDLRVLVAQFTTAGAISGQIQVQMFVEGDQSQEFRQLFTYSNIVNGCTDELACNYDPEANDDDGSCLYDDALGECGGDCDEDADADGICDDEDDCVGVLDACGVCNGPGAVLECGCEDIPEGDCDCDGNQLDALDVCGGLCALDEDGDGICDEEYIPGCTISFACNYNPEATLDDGSCDFLSCINFGCDDMDACNYDPEAEFNDGSCEYASFPYDCDNNCVNDEDGDGVCDEFELPGCTDPYACNYFPDATDDNGSCTYPEPLYDCDGVCVVDEDENGICDAYEDLPGCTDVQACNFNLLATIDDGSCLYLDALGVCGGTCASDVNDNGVCDDEDSEGCTDPLACNYVEAANLDDGSCTFAEDPYGCDGLCVNDEDSDGVCDELEVAGCMDELACNFMAEATDDDGSCVYPELYVDCDGNCLNDVNDNGLCDETETAGCLEEGACNFDPEATLDDGSCEYAPEFYNCDGSCVNDADGDGVCDELELGGCTDLDACNFDSEATDDDDSCEHPGDPCDDGDELTVNDVLTDDCGCEGEVPSSILEAAPASSWKLYPTPTQGILNLDIPASWHAGNSEMIITNTSGQEVRRELLMNQSQIDVSSLASGMYLLTIKAAGIPPSTQRFVVQKGR